MQRGENTGGGDTLPPDLEITLRQLGVLPAPVARASACYPPAWMPRYPGEEPPF
jgi:hypothetical protein